MELTTIEIDGIGPVQFERSKRARRLNISLRPFKGIRVAVPHQISYERAKDFVHSKIEWIKKHLTGIKQAEQERNSFGKNPVVINRLEARLKLLFRLQELAGKYGFTYNKAVIRNQKTRWGSCSSRNTISLNMKLAALPSELMDYVILHELVHTQIKNHSKNFWTALLPSELMDYVILHELVHTQIKNHSKNFWTALTKITGNVKTLNSELKKYKIEIV